MSKPQTLLIRADAGGDLGTGHVMRMIALAQAWQDQDGEVSFACCSCPDSLCDRLQHEKIQLFKIDADHGSEGDVEQTMGIAHLVKATWVALDGYHFTETFQKKLKSAGFPVLAVDDFGHCEKWHSDIVLNPNLHVGGHQAFLQASNPDVAFLLGPRYALLRREFATANKSSILHDSKPRVLINFGGVDSQGVTLKIVEALDHCREGDFEFRIIVGASFPHLSQLERNIKASTKCIELLVGVTDMPAQYRWADRIISAGGSSCHEWLLFNRCAWVVSIADNQDPVIAAIHEQHLATVAGRIENFTTAESLANSLQEWFDNPITQPSGIVDEWGATRVTVTMLHLPCFVRPVNEDEADTKFLLELANDPTVRSSGYHTNHITPDAHTAWMHRHCHSEASRLLMIEHVDLGRVGLVRFHLQEPRAWEIGISITPHVRGIGIAKAALQQAMRKMNLEFGEITWIARIRPENIASQRLFQTLGFQLQKTIPHETLWALTQ